MANKDFEVLKLGWDRVSAIQRDNQNRLYRLSTAYVVAVMAAIAFLLRDTKTFVDIPPDIWAIGSILSTFYVVFYSYVFINVINCATYLILIWKRLNEDFCSTPIRSWDGFQPDAPFFRSHDLINLFYNSWRTFVLALALAFAWLSQSECKESIFDQRAFLIALFLWICLGVPSVTFSFFYAYSGKKYHKKLLKDLDDSRQHTNHQLPIVCTF